MKKINSPPCYKRSQRPPPPNPKVLNRKKKKSTPINPEKNSAPNPLKPNYRAQCSRINNPAVERKCLPAPSLTEWRNGMLPALILRARDMFLQAKRIEKFPSVSNVFPPSSLLDV